MVVKLATEEVERQVATDEPPPTEFVVDEPTPTNDMPPKKVVGLAFLCSFVITSSICYIYNFFDFFAAAGNPTYEAKLAANRRKVGLDVSGGCRSGQAESGASR